MEWKDPTVATKFINDIQSKINLNLYEILKIKDKISKLNEFSDNYYTTLEKLNDQIKNLESMNEALAGSISDIKALGNDTDHTYSLEQVDGEMHNVRKGDEGIVFIQYSTRGSAIHEIKHVSQALNTGYMEFDNVGLLKNPGEGYKIAWRAAMMTEFEIEAYRAQYAFDSSFMYIPVKSIRDINISYLRDVELQSGQYGGLIRKYVCDRTSVNKHTELIKQLKSKIG